MIRGIAITLVIVGVLWGCGGPAQTSKIDPSVQLEVTFGDSAWGGPEVPIDGRCRSCGGRGRSPALRIGGLPPEADEVIVEFNDLRVPELARNGGHGALGIATGGKAEILVPSVREETMNLPRGVRSVSAHRCVFFGHKAGAYKAPCGCGQGNPYVASVKAVRHVGDRTEVLARTEIALGIF